jgi:alpha-galactosidase
VDGGWTFQAVETLGEALTGADFIIISILPGTFEEMRSDVHTPEKYGIWQPVGDTVGPGGIVRALRTVPMFQKIAEAIREYAPEAWVINYTNPMSVCLRALTSVFPGIKAYGCCHEVFGTQALLARALEDQLGINNVTRDEIQINVLGINHFTWIDKATYKEIDLFPIYRKFIDTYDETGFEGTEKGHWMNSVFASCERVKFDLFRRYGIIGAAGDRHLAEFVPGYWYLKDPETVRAWKFNLTTVDWRIEDLNRKLEATRRLLAGEEAFELRDTGEEGVRQMKAILGLGEFVTNVNLPNIGQMEGLPMGAVVETNALFSRGSVRPVRAGKLPDPVQGLVLRQVMNQETVTRAALTKDYELAFGAFVNDPLVTVSLGDAKILFNEMLENTKAYL